MVLPYSMKGAAIDMAVPGIYQRHNVMPGLERRTMTQRDVIQEVKASGLRGRGGAGYNAGMKRDFSYMTQADQKYVVCNADEGEPGTYKDRIIMENDPQSVLEGMAICGYAIGANKGYIYCRGEYPYVVDKL